MQTKFTQKEIGEIKLPSPAGVFIFFMKQKSKGGFDKRKDAKLPSPSGVFIFFHIIDDSDAQEFVGIYELPSPLGVFIFFIEEPKPVEPSVPETLPSPLGVFIFFIIFKQWNL